MMFICQVLLYYSVYRIYEKLAIKFIFGRLLTTNKKSGTIIIVLLNGETYVLPFALLFSVETGDILMFPLKKM